MMYTQQEIITMLIPVFKQFPIKRAALFGSYARNQQTSESDLDIFLEIDDSADIVSVFYDFWDELEAKINLKADVLTPGSLTTAPKRFRERILSELRYIYEA